VYRRGPVFRVIFQKHRPVTQWGQPHRADLTFSLAKTYGDLLVVNLSNR
jgi:hypothetical protein